MLARSKLNGVECKISGALINKEISHEDFTTIINEEKNYRELKEGIRMMKTERSDTVKNYMTGEDKRKGIDEIIRQSVSIKQCYLIV